MISLEGRYAMHISMGYLLRIIPPSMDIILLNMDTIHPSMDTIILNMDTIHPSMDTIILNMDTIRPNIDTISPGMVIIPLGHFEFLILLEFRSYDQRASKS